MTAETLLRCGGFPTESREPHSGRECVK